MPATPEQHWRECDSAERRERRIFALMAYGMSYGTATQKADAEQEAADLHRRGFQEVAN